MISKKIVFPWYKSIVITWSEFTICCFHGNDESKWKISWLKCTCFFFFSIMWYMILASEIKQSVHLASSLHHRKTIFFNLVDCNVNNVLKWISFENILYSSLISSLILNSHYLRSFDIIRNHVLLPELPKFLF